MTNKMGQKKMRLEEKEHDKALRRASQTTMIKQTFFQGKEIEKEISEETSGILEHVDRKSITCET